VVTNGATIGEGFFLFRFAIRFFSRRRDGDGTSTDADANDD
jgi:hypothetical protein